jgi:flagellar biosynthesis/type III secretory pathway protein FliH
VTLTRGRIVKAAHQAVRAEPAGANPGALPLGRIARREVVDAEARARAIVARAEQQAARMVEIAERAAAEVRLRAESEGRADGAAAIAAHALALAAQEAQADERGLDRAVELARLLAERLLGETLALDPTRVVALAREALREARGARKLTLRAHPEDAPLLERSLAELGLDQATASVVADASRSRGNLRIQTEIGVLDAELAPELDRLAAKLRESLAK